MPRFAIWSALLSVAVGVGGCDTLRTHHDGDAGSINACVTPSSPTTVQGTWTITGSGSRRDCSRRVLDADSFELASPPLMVTQAADGALSLGDSAALWGNVLGQCSFHTKETTSEGDITYDWQVAVLEPNHLAGTFTGTGPGNCKSGGSFDVSIE